MLSQVDVLYFILHTSALRIGFNLWEKYFVDLILTPEMHSAQFI